MRYLKAPINVRADWTVYSNLDKPLADIHGCEDDARLIAAAPAMLRALQRLTHPMADDEDLRDALAVIARATGQPVPEDDEIPDAFPPDDDGPLEPDEYSDEAADAAEDRWLAVRAAPYGG